MEEFASQDPRSFSFYFDLKFWFPPRNVSGTFEKLTPDSLPIDYSKVESNRFFFFDNLLQNILTLLASFHSCHLAQ